jgi:hypothetical protein
MAPHRTVTLPTQTELRELLRYDSQTGQLFWKERPGTMNAAQSFNTRHAGQEAFTSLKDGYRRGLLFQESVYAHRVIWKIMTGEDASEIDHIDGNPLNNAWRNLRDIRGGNQKNSRKRHDNTSGHVGVVRRGERWIAQFGINGTTRHIGIYNTKEEAIAARKQAELEYGFHPNHGRNSTPQRKESTMAKKPKPSRKGGKGC